MIEEHQDPQEQCPRILALRVSIHCYGEPTEERSVRCKLPEGHEGEHQFTARR